MRLSEAILLGRVTVKPRMLDITSCALGMAANAVGIKQDYCCIYERWPWLYRSTMAGCHICGLKMSTYLVEIAHLFDSHVMSNYIRQISIEELAEWVATIEPPDPQEVKEAFETVREMPEETFAERFERIQGMTPQEWDRKLSIHRHGV